MPKAPKLGHYRSRIGTWLAQFRAPSLIKGDKSSQFHSLLHYKYLTICAVTHSKNLCWVPVMSWAPSLSPEWGLSLPGPVMGGCTDTFIPHSARNPLPAFPARPKEKGGKVVKNVHMHYLRSYLKCRFWAFLGGAVVKNPPAGDTGLSPGPGRSHMPRSN